FRRFKHEPSQTIETVERPIRRGTGRRTATMRDVGIQTDNYQSFSNDELNDPIVSKLSNHHFFMSTSYIVPLRKYYEMRHAYKAFGATYDGLTKTWFILPGTNLRPLFDLHGDWLDEPEMLRRRILMHMTDELERDSYLF
ncbi:MAG: hypothetical protein ACKPKO_30610, partial [Candidatus Fonsibacter sp.]